ncbi:MAG: HNH endonuclease [Cyclobacteriaceae bacterium]|nr:HNH endonuclease [Cyclobacteriaceae bacterium]
MTSQLRDQIKQRDNYKCYSCSLGIENEPNLLLEIDHIIPLSKGGMTTLENLQTLCWKCNRTKGAKIKQS